MSLNQENLLKEVLKLDYVQELKVTVKYSFTYGSLIGLATAISALALGPRGLVLGGVVSSIITGYVAHGQFKSVPDIVLNEMTPAQRNKLCNKLFGFINTQNVKTLREFISAITTEQEFMHAIIQILTMFLYTEMQYEVHM